MFLHSCCYKIPKFWGMLKTQSTVQEDQYDQSLQCLPTCLHLLVALLNGITSLFKLWIIRENILPVSETYGILFHQKRAKRLRDKISSDSNIYLYHPKNLLAGSSL